jgi:hypothetical protein
MSAVATPARGPRRAVILGVVIVALAIGIGTGRSHTTRPARLVAPTDAAERSGEHALSTAWYCPGLPGSFATRDQTLTLSNLGPADADAVVTVQPDNHAPPIVRGVRVPHDTVRTFSRATLADVSSTSGSGAGATAKPLPAGPIVVESFSPDVVVQAGAESGSQLDLVSCADNASADWYFSAGTTVRGASQWLVLDDPYSADARVDVTLRTDTGMQQLPGLQGIDVPGRSRVVIAMQDQAVRQPRVSVQVHASVGRVVASQTLQFGAASGPVGLASSLGVLAPSSQWWFTDGKVLTGASQYVAITNMSEVDASVDVLALFGSKAIGQPVVLTVAPGTVNWVQVGGCGRLQKGCLVVPADSEFALEVQSDNHVPILAQTLSRYGSTKVALGATTSTGGTLAAREWVVARTRALDEQSTSISMMNAGGKTAHVSIDIVHAGIVSRPAELQNLTLGPNASAVLPADTAGPAHVQDAALLFTADEPIFVESTIFARRDATRVPGIPTR